MQRLGVSAKCCPKCCLDKHAPNEDKTDQLYYTSGINCNVDFARDQFDTTKIRFGKLGGIVALHAYQSFKEGEVTPDEAHAIGVELARELWGDRFQCVVATHLNTNCVHNHIVINSVSFTDGLKFHDCRDTYRLLREASDSIDRIMGRSGLEKLYLRYCYELGYLPKYRQNPAKLHILLKEDLLKCDRYSEQAKLLAKYHVDTDEDLSKLMEDLNGKMGALSSKRDEIRLVVKRVGPEEKVAKAKEDIREITAEIRGLRHELKVCGEVQERSGHIRENLKVIDRDREKERDR